MAAEHQTLSGPRAYQNLETLRCVFPEEGILHVELNRPNKLNAMNSTFWVEYKQVFEIAAHDPEVRVIVVSSNARIFTAGLDLAGGMGLVKGDADAGRRGIALYHQVLNTQATFTAQANCQKPSIAVVHGACIGAGVDLISAADIRYCSTDAYFCVKEVDIALAADVGTLQRLPKVVGNDSWVREMCYTARNASSQEAFQVGLISKVCDNKEAALQAALETARLIASKSPVAVVSTKSVLNYSRDHTVEEGLAYVAAWNAFALQSKDLPVAAVASLSKKQAKFPKL